MGRRRNVWQVARLSSAALLVAAGTLKLVAGSKSFELGAVTISPQALELVSLGEIALGGWLLSGFSASLTRWVSVAVFSGFAALSGLFAWQGASTCGCLGEASLPPLAMLGVDLTFVGLLLAGRVPEQSRVATPRPIPALAAVAIAVLGLVVVRPTGARTLASLVKGEPLSTPLDSLDYGELGRGEFGKQEIIVENNSSSPVRLVGGTWDCSCMVGGLPLVVEPFGKASVTANLRIPPDATPGRFVRDVEVWTDAPGQPVMRLPVVCSVR